MDIITEFPHYFLTYLHAVNLIYAGVIAVFFGLATTGAAGLFLVPVMATVVYIAARAIIPPVVNHVAVVTPNFDVALAEQAVTLYIGFFVSGLIIYALKRSAQSVFG